MRPPVRFAMCLWISGAGVCAQVPDLPSFEAVSIKLPSPSSRSIECSGGPGTLSPLIWRCSNVPLGFVITRAYGFAAYQFPPNHSCCQARFDFTATIASGTTKEQFQQMLQRILVERFKLALHHEPKEMPVFELTASEHGPKMKLSPLDRAPAPEDPWAIPSYTVGEDGYPVFPAGHGGLAGPDGRYRWVGYNVSLSEIIKTLSFHLGRPILDGTKLTGTYDVDLKWGVDVAWLLERAGRRDQIEDLPDRTPGPNLIRAVQDQLGLKLTSRRGLGDLVVIDHLEKTPLEN